MVSDSGVQSHEEVTSTRVPYSKATTQQTHLALLQVFEEIFYGLGLEKKGLQTSEGRLSKGPNSSSCQCFPGLMISGAFCFQDPESPCHSPLVVASDMSKAQTILCF